MSCARNSSLSVCRTVIRGLSDAYGSWNTICIRRRAVVMDARGLAPAAERPEREVAFDAVVLRERAAWMEATAGRRVGEIGWSPGNRREHVAPVVDVGHGAQEAERVGMARLAEH